MLRHPPSAGFVPDYVEARSDDTTPTYASSDSSTNGPQAASSVTAMSPATKNIDVGRSSADVGIIVGTLIALGIIFFLLFLLYGKKGDASVNPVAWWRQRKAAAEPAEMNISDPMMTRAVFSDDVSTLYDAYDEKLNESQRNLVLGADDEKLNESQRNLALGADDEKLNESQRNLVPGADDEKLNGSQRSLVSDAVDKKLNESQRNLVPAPSEAQPKRSIIQKIQHALSGAFNSKFKQDANALDMEKGESSVSLEDRPTSTESVRRNDDEWSRRPTSTSNLSIQTKSSMAMHPGVARIKSQKKGELRPGVSAFSWSTTAPTPVPPSHVNMRENPLPPLPSNRDSRRDTTLTTMSEDSQPTRHKSLTSWVENQKTRQEKRGQRLQQAVPENSERIPQQELLAPPPVANPNARKATDNGVGSVRLTGMTAYSNIDTPALQTATMAWQVQRGPGQVEVPPMPRSAAEDQNQGLGLQDENDDYNEQNQYSREEQYAQQDEYPQQEGEYPQQYQYSERDGAYLQEADYLQQYEQQEQDGYSQEYSQQEQEGYSQQYEQQEQDEHEQQHEQQEYEQPPEIQVNSPAEAAAIPEEDWIPNVTRYSNGTTTTSSDAPERRR